MWGYWGMGHNKESFAHTPRLQYQSYIENTVEPSQSQLRAVSCLQINSGYLCLTPNLQLLS